MQRYILELAGAIVIIRLVADTFLQRSAHLGATWMTYMPMEAPAGCMFPLKKTLRLQPEKLKTIAKSEKLKKNRCIRYVSVSKLILPFPKKSEESQKETVTKNDTRRIALILLADMRV